MQYLTLIKTLISLLPLLVQAITAIEAAFPQSGQGSVKLELVKQTLLGAAEVSEDMDAGKFDALWPALKKTVGALVALANSSGVFGRQGG